MQCLWQMTGLYDWGGPLISSVTVLHHISRWNPTDVYIITEHNDMWYVWHLCIAQMNSAEVFHINLCSHWFSLAEFWLVRLSFSLPLQSSAVCILCLPDWVTAVSYPRSEMHTVICKYWCVWWRVNVMRWSIWSATQYIDKEKGFPRFLVVSERWLDFSPTPPVTMDFLT